MQPLCGASAHLQDDLLSRVGLAWQGINTGGAGVLLLALSSQLCRVNPVLTAPGTPSPPTATQVNTVHH